MNAERLLEVYEQISEAPDAIARLRRFVLDLAVRGKLVEQDARDKPASHLLIEIAEEKAAHKANGKKSSRRSTASEDDNGAASFNLPATWQWTTLAEISHQIHYGYTASAAPLEKECRLLRITDIQNDSVDWDTVPGCVIDEATFAKFALQPNDLLIARTGGTIGKTFLVDITPVKSVFASYLIRVQPTSALHAQYVKLFCGSDTYWDQLREGSRGGGQPNVNGQTLGRLKMPLPPLAEQHRIVAKVDELMALCDRLEEARKTREETRDKLTAASLARLTAPDMTAEDFHTHANFALEALPALTTRPDQIKTLRQTILNLAVRGKLVEQDPADEPALDHLLGLDGMPSKTRKLLKPLKPLDCGGNLPASWVWLPLGAIIRAMDAGWSPQCENHPRSDLDEWGVLKTTAVQALAFDPMQHKLLPTKLKPRPEFQAEIGDILVTRAGPKNRVGVSCVVDVPCPKLMISDKLIRFHAVGDLSPRYIALTLNAGYTFDQIEAAKSGMAVMQMNISQGKLRAIPIPLPPLAEQHRIVAKVDALMALCDRLEAALTTTDTTRTRLLEALLHDALEPAADCLEAAE